MCPLKCHCVKSGDVCLSLLRPEGTGVGRHPDVLSDRADLFYAPISLSHRQHADLSFTPFTALLITVVQETLTTVIIVCVETVTG